MITKQIALQLLNKGKAIQFKTNVSTYVALKKGKEGFELFTYTEGSQHADVSVVSIQQLLDLWKEENATRNFRVVESF